MGRGGGGGGAGAAAAERIQQVTTSKQERKASAKASTKPKSTKPKSAAKPALKGANAAASAVLQEGSSVEMSRAAVGGTRGGDGADALTKVIAAIERKADERQV
jgi:hypothetical protein